MYKLDVLIKEKRSLNVGNFKEEDAMYPAQEMSARQKGKNKMR